MNKYDAYREGRLSIKFPSALDRLNSHPSFGDTVLDTYYKKGRRAQQHVHKAYLQSIFDEMIGKFDAAAMHRAFNATPKQLADAANRARELHDALQGKTYPLEDVLIEIGLSTIPEFNGWEC